MVVDIDLSWGDGSSADADGGQRVLREFLQAYPGSAPLIFPKRVEPAPDGTRRLAASPLDDVFEDNSRLGWAHASFETDGGGAVRYMAGLAGGLHRRRCRVAACRRDEARSNG